MSEDFSPISAVIGGAMIGLSAVLLMLVKGRIAGISGIASRLLPPVGDGEDWGRLAFILGIVAAPGLWALANGGWPMFEVTHSRVLLLVSGALVGAGTVIGNGCTSGHGVIGLALFSRRSLAATMTFLGVAMATASLLAMAA